MSTQNGTRAVKPGAPAAKKTSPQKKPPQTKKPVTKPLTGIDKERPRRDSSGSVGSDFSDAAPKRLGVSVDAESLPPPLAAPTPRDIFTPDRKNQRPPSGMSSRSISPSPSRSPSPPPPLTEEERAAEGEVDSVKVWVRFRPTGGKDEEEAALEDDETRVVEARARVYNIHQTYDWVVDSRKNSIHQKGSAANLYFDGVFAPDTKTGHLFHHVARPIVDQVAKGYNGTIFAYGQTGSGKTFTMMGEKDAPGLIPMSIAYLFEHIAKQADKVFLLRISYMELYNEEINDLLDVSRKNLALRETKEGGFAVADLTEKIVTSMEEVMRLIDTGASNRRMGVSNLNLRSSRSHTIFRLLLQSGMRADAPSDPGVDFNGKVKVSELNLVDLAGSETLSYAFGQGQQKETKFINLSLTNLKTVIQHLSQKKPHIPYRSSKLTKILKTSLGGNAKTTLVLAASPLPKHEKMTKSTLNFGAMAKKITNNARVNEVEDDASVLLRQYESKIKVLEAQLATFTKLQDEKTQTEKSYQEVMAKLSALQKREEEREAEYQRAQAAAAAAAAEAQSAREAKAEEAARAMQAAQAAREEAAQAVQQAQAQVLQAQQQAKEQAAAAQEALLAAQAAEEARRAASPEEPEATEDSDRQLKIDLNAEKLRLEEQIKKEYEEKMAEKLRQEAERKQEEESNWKKQYDLMVEQFQRSQQQIAELAAALKASAIPQHPPPDSASRGATPVPGPTIVVTGPESEHSDHAALTSPQEPVSGTQEYEPEPGEEYPEDEDDGTRRKDSLDDTATTSSAGRKTPDSMDSEEDDTRAKSASIPASSSASADGSPLSPDEIAAGASTASTSESAVSSSAAETTTTASTSTDSTASSSTTSSTSELASSSTSETTPTSSSSSETASTTSTTSSSEPLDHSHFQNTPTPRKGISSEAFDFLLAASKKLPPGPRQQLLEAIAKAQSATSLEGARAILAEVSDAASQELIVVALRAFDILHNVAEKESTAKYATPEKERKARPCQRCQRMTDLRCSGCKAAWYCSGKCQYEDWPAHKLVCRKTPAATPQKDQTPRKHEVKNYMGSIFLQDVKLLKENIDDILKQGDTPGRKKSDGGQEVRRLSILQASGSSGWNRSSIILPPTPTAAATSTTIETIQSKWRKVNFSIVTAEQQFIIKVDQAEEAKSIPLNGSQIWVVPTSRHGKPNCFEMTKGSERFVFMCLAEHQLEEMLQLFQRLGAIIHRLLKEGWVVKQEQIKITQENVLGTAEKTLETVSIQWKRYYARLVAGKGLLCYRIAVEDDEKERPVYHWTAISAVFIVPESKYSKPHCFEVDLKSADESDGSPTSAERRTSVTSGGSTNAITPSGSSGTLGVSRRNYHIHAFFTTQAEESKEWTEALGKIAKQTLGADMTEVARAPSSSSSS